MSPATTTGPAATRVTGAVVTAPVVFTTAAEHAAARPAGGATVRSVGFLHVATVCGPPSSVAPASVIPSVPAPVVGAEVSSAGPPYVILAVHERGVATFVQGGRVQACGPGDVVVLDAATPFAFDEAEDFRLCLVGVPGRLLGLRADEAGRLCRLHPRGRGRVASLLGRLVADVAAVAPDLPPRPAEHLAAGIVGLLAALAAETEAPEDVPPGVREAPAVRETPAGGPPTGAEPPGRGPSTAVAGTPYDAPHTTGKEAADRHSLAPRLRAYVNERLGDRDLTPGGIAAHHHISTRLLHKLFAAEGITVSRWIQRRRLQECRRELAGVRSGRPGPAVASVAKRWGFANAAHFSRSFRAAYGMSPAAWRDLHVPPAHPSSEG
ncbi:AraC family transcriptional regulator [Streptomyces sp. URMC 126]|uniref:AraC family transcriptional regulator n=1 Tax=Streptomyces sp. URMC 126 TaxID=3423401 RepID=UPI003F1D6F3E